jgi:hypothetical protein
MKSKLALLLSVLILSACAQQGDTGKQEYPKTWKDKQAERLGKITGEDGLVVFGSNASSKGEAQGVGVNAYLWGAALDFVHKIPLLSADPFAGIISTDWYQAPNQSGVRYKLSIYIIGMEMRSDSLRVSVAKQVLDKSGQWVQIEQADDLSAEIEDKILLKAREIKYKNNQ